MKNIKSIVIAIIAIAVLVYLIFGRGPKTEPLLEAPGTEMTEEGAPTSTPATAPSPAPGSKPAPAPSPKPAPKPTAASGIKITTPSAGDVWAYNKTHDINWSKAGGYKGGIQLIDASSGQTVGWILAHSVEKQVAYSWNTREVFIDREGGNRKDITPGTYKIKIVFDEKLSPIESENFTVTAAGNTEVLSYVVRIQNTDFNPTPVSVPQGGRLYFVNGDSVSHKITSDSFPSFDVAPGSYHLFETSGLAKNTYYYNSSVYQSQAFGTIIIK